jgi:integrase/recombinase XerD
MTPLRQKMIEDMQLRGLAGRTQEAYLRAADGLAKYFGKSPAELSEAELRQYLLYLKNDRQVAAGTWLQITCGLKFLVQNTLRRQWTVLDLSKPDREREITGGVEPGRSAAGAGVPKKVIPLSGVFRARSTAVACG